MDHHSTAVGATPGRNAYDAFWEGSAAQPWAELFEHERRAWEVAAVAGVSRETFGVPPGIPPGMPWDGYGIGASLAALRKAYADHRAALDRAGARPGLAIEGALTAICRLHGTEGTRSETDLWNEIGKLLGVGEQA